jgi:hypothetical protein
MLLAGPLPPRPALWLKSGSYAQENALHYNLTLAMLFVGGFALILGIVFAFAAILENRRQNAAPFRNYFGSEYDRSLLRDDSFSEGEYIVSRPQTRFEDFDDRYLGPTDWPRVSDTTQPKRE